MKIAFISSGSSIHVKKIANSLIAKGHDITIFTLPQHTKLIDQFNPKIEIVILPHKIFGYFSNVFYLKKRLRIDKFDIVNSHYASGYGTLGRLANCHPYVVSVFGSDIFVFPHKSKMNKYILKKNLEKSDCIFSTSNVMKKEIEKLYDMKKEIYLTPFGVNLNLLPCRLNNHKSNDIFKFGTVKKLEKIYGIDVLIKAFKILVDDGQENISLEIYGRGSYQKSLEKLAKNLGIANKVHFNGFIQNEQIYKAFSNIDVACFPSISESFGVAVLEAFACGVPVISSDAPGFQEIMINKKTGYIVPKNDIQSLSEKMKKMLNMSFDGLHKMGQNGREIVIEKYNIEENMDNYERLLIMIRNKFEHQ